MDALTRDRVLRLAGVVLPAVEERGHPHPGQHYKHGWIPVAADVPELLTPAEADRDYGDELDRVEFGAGDAVVARSEGTLTIQSDAGDVTQVHASPSPSEAHEWADYIDAGLDLGEGETTSEHGLTVLRTADGLSLRWPQGDEDADPEDLDGVDLPEDDVAAFTQALRDMAYVTEDNQTVPDEDEEPGPDAEPDEDSAAMARHRTLQLLGIEVRAARKPLHYGAGVAGGKGGQFRPIADQIMDVLRGADADDPDPLKGFSQPQLKKAAEQLGLNPPKGMRLVPLKGLIMAHGRSEHGVPNAPEAAEPDVSAKKEKQFTQSLGGWGGSHQAPDEELAPSPMDQVMFQGGHRPAAHGADVGRPGPVIKPQPKGGTAKKATTRPAFDAEQTAKSLQGKSREDVEAALKGITSRNDLHAVSVALGDREPLSDGLTGPKLRQRILDRVAPRGQRESYTITEGGGVARVSALKWGSSAVHVAPPRYPDGPTNEQIQAMSDADLRKLAKSRGVPNAARLGRAGLLDKLDVPDAPKTASRKPSTRSPKPDPAKVSADFAEAVRRPMPSDRERFQKELGALTGAQLAEVAAAHGVKLPAGTKQKKVNELVEAKIGYRLNSEAIQHSTRHESDTPHSEVKEQIRQLKAIGAAMAEADARGDRAEYERLHLQRVDLGKDVGQPKKRAKAATPPAAAPATPSASGPASPRSLPRSGHQWDWETIRRDNMTMHGDSASMNLAQALHRAGREDDQGLMAPEHRDRVLAMATRAAGHDVMAGHDELHHYWTRGEGLAKWAESPKPWTTLVAHLTKYVGPEKAKVFASRWFIEVFHYAAGSDKNRVAHGHPPRGHRVGPG